MAEQNFNDQLNNISRRRAMADMLRQRGIQSGQNLGQTQMAGGYAIPNKGGAEINAVLQQLLGAWQDKKLGKEEDAVKEKQRNDMKEWATALQTVGQPDQLQPIQMDTSGIDMSRVTPETAGKIESLNSQAQADTQADIAGGPNRMFEHLLSGLDKGGYAQQIAGTQLASQMAPPSYKTVAKGGALVNAGTGEEVYRNTGGTAGAGGELKPLASVPGVFTDERGNLYKSGGNNQPVPLTSEEVQQVAMQVKRSGVEGTGYAPDGRELGPMEMRDREYYGENTNKLLPTLRGKLNTGEQALELIGKIPEERFQTMSKYIVELGRDGWAEKLLESAFLNDEERQLAATLKRMALAMRPIGSGAVSDFEQKIFASAAGDQAGWSRNALTGNIENAFIEPNMLEYNDLVDGWNKYSGPESQRERYEYNVEDYIAPPKTVVDRKQSPDGTQIVDVYSDGTISEPYSNR